MNNKQEGFDENETQTFAFVSSHIDSKPYEPLKTKSKQKMNFKPPLTIFNNIQMTLSPEDNLKFCDNDKQTQIIDIESVNFTQSDKVLSITPLQAILFKQQKNMQLYQNDSSKIIYEKISDVFPKKFLCIYNKFQENILIKYDLTIVIKNISKMIKFELLKSIQSPFLLHPSMNSVEPVEQTENNLNLRESNIKLRKTARYQSQLKKNGEMISPRKNNFTNFQLQKSIILNGQVNKKMSQIEFFSNFESGNMHLVFKDKLNENLFYLFLTNDTNTHGCNQWFYFGAKYTDTQRDQKFRFLIMNISKQFKFQQGMKLLTLKDNKWSRQIPFNTYKNKYSRYNNTGNLITIDFQYEFTGQKNETVFFALMYPYSFTRLNRFLKQIKSKTYKNLVVSIQSLGKSESTNNIPLVKIQKTQQKNGAVQKFKKSCILIVARQHASETPSSFICQSLIQLLLSEQQNQWKSLLNNFTFVIAPMLNPDGVIHGNSRTNIKGYDMNRLWQMNRNGSYMSVQSQAMNNYISSLQRQYIIQYAIDLHSHSKEYGSFAYSCDNSEVSKLFSFYFTEKYPQCVYNKCKVNLTPDKRFTFRGQMFHRLGIKKSFTIETSYYGFRRQKYNSRSSLIPFNLQNFQNIAVSLLYALKETQKTKTKSQAKKVALQNIEIMDAKYKVFRQNTEAKNREHQNSSDSDPERQYLDLKQRQENGQNFHKISVSNSRNNNLVQDKKSFQQILQSTQKAKGFALQSRSLQMVSKASCSFLSEQQVKQRRKRIFTTKVNRSITENKQIPNQMIESFLPKKYTTQAEKQLDFRRTLRRGYRMAHSESSFYESYSVAKKVQQKQQQKNFIIYPTSNDLQINHQKIRLLHEKLFQGKIKVKSIKQQDRLLKRIGKPCIINKDGIMKTKNLFTNKFLKQYSQRQEFSDVLNIAKLGKNKKYGVNNQRI